MYCKYCGQKLPEGSRFCNGCGQPVEGPPRPEGRGGLRAYLERIPFPLIATVFLSVLFSERIVIALLYGPHVYIRLRDLILSLIMFGALIALCVTKRILPAKIRAYALLFPAAMLLLTLVKIFFCVALAALVNKYFAASLVVRALIEFPTVELAWGVGTVKRWGMLILFLLLLSGTLRIRRTSFAVLTASVAAVLIVWSAILTFVYPMDSWIEHDPFLLPIYRAYFAAVWIRELAVYLFVLLAGTGKLSVLRTVLFPVVIGAASLSLLVIAVLLFHHATLAVRTLTVGYLIGLLFLLPVCWPRKRRPA